MMTAKHAVSIGALMLCAACATPERIVLLPDAGAKPTSIEVRAKSGSAVLSQPYAEAVVTARDTVVGKTDAEAVAKRYADVINATPAAPKLFIVYYQTGGNELTAESLSVVESIPRELAGRPAAEVIVTGHTDRVGTIEANDALSAKRAAFIRDSLIANGVPPARIFAVGRGEREPLIATADEVDEPRNRRVEIKIR
jgi:outer membrane protein OmpA-like peptidoglycan-associated protein